MGIIINSQGTLSGFEKLRMREEDYIRIALYDACESVQDEARSTHNFKSTTGALEHAIELSVNEKQLQGEVFINADMVPYGVFVHEPTGTYAPTSKRMKSKYYRWPDGSYAIRPTNKKILRFVGQNGGVVSVLEVMHPGTPADPFIYNAAESKETEVVNSFRDYVRQSIQEANL